MRFRGNSFQRRIRHRALAAHHLRLYFYNPENVWVLFINQLWFTYNRVLFFNHWITSGYEPIVQPDQRPAGQDWFQSSFKPLTIWRLLKPQPPQTSVDPLAEHNLVCFRKILFVWDAATNLGGLTGPSSRTEAKLGGRDCWLTGCCCVLF